MLENEIYQPVVFNELLTYAHVIYTVLCTDLEQKALPDDIPHEPLQTEALYYHAANIYSALEKIDKVMQRNAISFFSYTLPDVCKELQANNVTAMYAYEDTLIQSKHELEQTYKSQLPYNVPENKQSAGFTHPASFAVMLCFMRNYTQRIHTNISPIIDNFDINYTVFEEELSSLQDAVGKYTTRPFRNLTTEELLYLVFTQGIHEPEEFAVSEE